MAISRCHAMREHRGYIIPTMGCFATLEKEEKEGKTG
jgi:hypothetical protein